MKLSCVWESVSGGGALCIIYCYWASSSIVCTTGSNCQPQILYYRWSLPLCVLLFCAVTMQTYHRPDEQRFELWIHKKNGKRKKKVIRTLIHYRSWTPGESHHKRDRWSGKTIFSETIPSYFLPAYQNHFFLTLGWSWRRDSALVPFSNRAFSVTTATTSQHISSRLRVPIDRLHDLTILS